MARRWRLVVPVLALLLTFVAVYWTAQAEPPAEEKSPAEQSDSSAAATEEKKSKREPIYEEESNGAELIAAAVERAHLEGKHVIVKWGGNWCGWCFKLHDVFHKDPLVAPVVAQEYELVLVDAHQNMDLLKKYGGQDTQFAYPHLTILDGDGQTLTNQETGSLEIGREHDPQKVADFLNQWTPEKVDAEKLISAAQARATSEDKRILLHVGTPYCGWCKVLTKFLHDHDEVLGRDYIDLKIDTMRMEHGTEVAERFLPEGCQGDPWIVILDGAGTTLATSVGSAGNIGYPLRPNEVDHFLSMLTGTRQRMTDDDLGKLRADLESYREQFEAKRAAAKP